ncbi:MAG TPA: PRC-barrel domain-containing protein [Phenylobacterium sp.]|nr:PRC-barrel domain-containing protein [Phenylobacterium sp.]
MTDVTKWLMSQGVLERRFIGLEPRWRRSHRSSWFRPAAWRTAGPEAADHPGRHLITAGRVAGSPVFDRFGARAGRIADISIEKASGQIVHVLLAMGGAFGLGRRFHPLPWALFSYEPSRRGYVLPFRRQEIRAMASLARDELEWCGAGPPEAWDFPTAEDIYLAGWMM